jgi:hypothetical protein
MTKARFALSVLVLLTLTPRIANASVVDLTTALQVVKKTVNSSISETPSSATAHATASSVFPAALYTKSQTFSGSASTSANVSLSGYTSTGTGTGTWDVTFQVTEPGISYLLVTLKNSEAQTITSIGNGFSTGYVDFSVFDNGALAYPKYTQIAYNSCTTYAFCSKTSARSGSESFVFWTPHQYDKIELKGTDAAYASGIFTLAGANANATWGITAFSTSPLTASFAASTPTAIIPEPSTWAMMLLGFMGLGYAACRGGRKGRIAVTA